MTPELELIKRHTIIDRERLVSGKLYLKLLHGREDPADSSTFWGDTGPWIGPLNYVHISRLTCISLCFETGEETSPEYNAHVFGFREDWLYYDNMYYGDFEVATCP